MAEFDKDARFNLYDGNNGSGHTPAVGAYHHNTLPYWPRELPEDSAGNVLKEENFDTSNTPLDPAEPMDLRPIYGDGKVWKRGVAGKPIKGRWNGTSGHEEFEHEKEESFSDRISAIEAEAGGVLTSAQPGPHGAMASKLSPKVTCEYKTGSLRVFVPVTKDADYRIEAIYAKDASGAIVCWQFFDYCAPKLVNPMNLALYDPFGGVQPAPPYDGRKFIANCIAKKGGLYAVGKLPAPGTKITAYVKTDKYGLWSADAKTE